MRVFIIVLVLILSFQSWTKADDISDFQIEGMSIGDSLLDYLVEEEILKKKNMPSSYKNTDFFAAEFNAKLFNSSDFDILRFHLKSNDNKYKIYHVAAKIIYKNNDSDNCILKKDEITKELMELFGEDKIQYGKLKNHVFDKTGNSTTFSNYFNLNNGRIRIMCVNWSDEITNKQGWKDSFSVAIYSKAFDYWLTNKAYK